MKIRELLRRKRRPRRAEIRPAGDLRNTVQALQKKLMDSARDNLKPWVGS